MLVDPAIMASLVCSPFRAELRLNSAPLTLSAYALTFHLSESQPSSLFGPSLGAQTSVCSGGRETLVSRRDGSAPRAVACEGRLETGCQTSAGHGFKPFSNPLGAPTSMSADDRGETFVADIKDDAPSERDGGGQIIMGLRTERVGHSNYYRFSEDKSA